MWTQINQINQTVTATLSTLPIRNYTIDFFNAFSPTKCIIYIIWILCYMFQPIIWSLSDPMNTQKQNYNSKFSVRMYWCQKETASPVNQHIHIGYKNQLHVTTRTEYTYTPHNNIPTDTSCMSSYIHTPHRCCYLQTQQTNNDKF